MSGFHADNSIIDMLGGTGATARLCEVRSQAVTQWRRNGIPHARRKFLELARPDVFAGRAPTVVDRAPVAEHA